MNEAERNYVDSLRNSDSTNEPDASGVTDKLSRDERECILVYNDAERVWYADSSIPKFWRRLEKKGWTLVSTQYYSDGTVCSKSFKGSSKGVSITDPFKKREMSEEQKQRIRERFAKPGALDVLDDLDEDENDDEYDGTE